jgi:glutamyl-tRNA synthetase
VSKVVGRLAPSPTGALHIGNARSFLLAWLSVRQQSGALILRIEDIDSPRVKPWAQSQTLEDLRWLGLDWDYGPDVGGPHAPYIQTGRAAKYHAVLERLIADRVVYRCYCSRSEVAEAASAPHETANLLPPLEGAIYPGTCRQRQDVEGGAGALASQSGYAWRWRFAAGVSQWNDALLGKQSANPASQLGDFVIGKSDLTPAYQLAVVVDDYDMGVTEVVRGCDLVPSTYRQLAIQQHFGWPSPRYVHLPLITGQDGRRLAKRHGDSRLSHYRQRGVAPQRIVGYLAWSVGLVDHLEPLMPSELIGLLDWKKVQSAPTIFDERLIC